MSKIDDLQELLKKLPGIGPRQARRFVYFFLSADENYMSRLSSLINDLRSDKKICSFCRRVHFDSISGELCPTCSDTSRDQSKVLVIEKNSDFENFERSGVWDGRYFLILKNVGLTEDDPSARLQLDRLKTSIESGQTSEVVTALSVNPDGEYTTEYIHKSLTPLVKSHNLSISALARGLSTGSEIEYADSETLKNALENRK